MNAMSKLILAATVAAVLGLTASSALAGDRHGGHDRDAYVPGRAYSPGAYYHPQPGYWAGRQTFVERPRVICGTPAFIQRPAFFGSSFAAQRTAFVSQPAACERSVVIQRPVSFGHSGITISISW